MQIKKNNILQFLVISLFFVAPFVMSYEDIEKADVISAHTLPSFIAEFSSWIRWSLLGLLAFFYFIKRKSLKISSPVYFISSFFFIQFLYALFDGVDYIRFLLMTVFSLLIPPVIGLALTQRRVLLKYFIYSIAFFLILSIWLNGHLVLNGQRFFGFLNNPNAYGISTVFWLVLVLLSAENQLISKKLFIILFICLFLTMIFSGSRNAMVGFLVILVLKYYNRFNKLTIGVFILFIAFYGVSYYVDLSFVLDRLENLSNASSDSGRELIWERAYFAINQSFWWGNGMDANFRIANTGNMHNCYIRFMLNMGLIFTIATLLFYVLSMRATFKAKKKVHLILFGYLLVYGIMNIGEDFFVGLGSSVFIYLLFIYGFINHYITTQHDTSR